ncbi:MAG: hypothetical protein HRU20_24000 [Pseudomonadales bacterium]|nr:hypothetical protein [Pseudomonadales bacterium]
MSEKNIHEHITRIQQRREQALNNVEKAQACGWVTTEKLDREITQHLYSLIIGAAIQMIRNNSSTLQRIQLAIIDQYIDIFIA